MKYEISVNRHGRFWSSYYKYTILKDGREDKSMDFLFHARRYIRKQIRRKNGKAEHGVIETWRG